MDLEKLQELNEKSMDKLYRMARWLFILLVVSIAGNVVQALHKSSEVNLIADDNLYSDITQTQG